MSFNISPSVDFEEIDLTLTTTPQTNILAGLAGYFNWGPANIPRLITSGEDEVVSVFAKPTNSNYISYMMAFDFFQYSKGGYIVRVVDTDPVTGAKNAVATGKTPILIANDDEYETLKTTTDSTFLAKYPGSLGSGLVVDVADAIKFDSWEYKNNFSYTPSVGEYHIAVIDGAGKFTGSGAQGQTEQFVVSGTPTRGVKQQETYTVAVDGSVSGGTKQIEKIYFANNPIGSGGQFSFNEYNDDIVQIEKHTFSGIANDTGYMYFQHPYTTPTKQRDTVTFGGGPATVGGGGSNIFTFTFDPKTNIDPITISWVIGSTAADLGVALTNAIKAESNLTFVSDNGSGVVVFEYVHAYTYDVVSESADVDAMTCAAAITTAAVSNEVAVSATVGDTPAVIADAVNTAINADATASTNYTSVHVPGETFITVTHAAAGLKDKINGAKQLNVTTFSEYLIIGAAGNILVDFLGSDTPVKIAEKAFTAFNDRGDFTAVYTPGNNYITVSYMTPGPKTNMTATSSTVDGVTVTINTTKGGNAFIIDFDDVSCEVLSGVSATAITVAANMAASLKAANTVGVKKYFDVTALNDTFTIVHNDPTEQRVTLPAIVPAVGNVSISGSTVDIDGNPVDSYVLSTSPTEITCSLSYGDAKSLSAVRIADVMKSSGYYENISVIGSVITSSRSTAGSLSVSAGSSDVGGITVTTTVTSSGTKGSLLEKYELMTDSEDDTFDDGSSQYFVDVVNDSSLYVMIGQQLTPVLSNATYYMQGGADGTEVGLDGGIDLLSNSETIDIRFLIGGITVADQQKLIDVALSRRDCTAHVSPMLDDVFGSDFLSEILEWRLNEVNRDSSYAMYDSNWGYMKDKYNNKYRWVPCSSGTAGLIARMYSIGTAWQSPANDDFSHYLGYTKLAYSPNYVQRNQLYKNQINPIVSFPGEGIKLYGDKTGQTRPSAFDRINVRDAFIEIEKASANMAKYFLFKFNDEFTRSQFLNALNPYLRGVVGERGIEDFRVICDERNNDGNIITTNQLVADIYIKPKYSINYIKLRFSAIRSDVSFDEIESQQFA